MVCWCVALLLQADPDNFETTGRQSSTLGQIKWQRESGGSVRVVATDGRPLDIELKREAKADAGKARVEAFLGKWTGDDKSRFCACMCVLLDSPEPVTFRMRQYADKAEWKLGTKTWTLGKLPAFDFGHEGNNCGEWTAGKDSNTTAFTDNPGSWGIKAGFVEPRFENYRYTAGDPYEYALHLKTLLYSVNGKDEKLLAVVRWEITCAATVGKKAEVTACASMTTKPADLDEARKKLQEAEKNGRIGQAGYVPK